MERYENLGLVGEGSYGMVLKCRHKESNQIVAIKKFIESEDDKMVKKIALREIKMLKQLRHENLVNLLEVFRRKKRLFLVFEFVDRTVLDDLEKYPDGLQDNEVKSISFQVLRGLEFCHNHNVIHRDVKPENILISKSGVVKLCDFGFARTLATGPGEVFTDYVATRWYRAPELLVGDVNYGKAVDIWAVGCLLYEMATGDPLFPGDSDIDQLFHITKALGNLTQRHQEVFHKNPLFTGMRLPSVKIDQAGKKFSQLSQNLADLISKSLALDVFKRLSCLDMMKHAYFQESHFAQHFLETLKQKIEEETSTNPYLKSLAAQKSKRNNNFQSTKNTKEKSKDESNQNSYEKKKKNNEHPANDKDKQQHAQTVLPIAGVKTGHVRSSHSNKPKIDENNKLMEIINVRSENLHEDSNSNTKDTKSLLFSKKPIDGVGNNSEKCLKDKIVPSLTRSNGETSPDNKFYHRAILDMSVNQLGKNLPEISSSVSINRARGHDVIKQKKTTSKKTSSNKQSREVENVMLYPVAEKATLYLEHSKSNEEMSGKKRKDSRPRDSMDLGLPKVSGLVFPSVKTGDSTLMKTSPTRGGNRKASMAPTIPTIQNIDPFSTQFTPSKESSSGSRNNRENFPAV